VYLSENKQERKGKMGLSLLITSVKKGLYRLVIWLEYYGSSALD